MPADCAGNPSKLELERGVFEISAPLHRWAPRGEPRPRRKERLTLENAILRRRSTLTFSRSQDPQRKKRPLAAPARSRKHLQCNSGPAVAIDVMLVCLRDPKRLPHCGAGTSVPGLELPCQQPRCVCMQSPCQRRQGRNGLCQPVRVSFMTAIPVSMALAIAVATLSGRKSAIQTTLLDPSSLAETCTDAL